MAIVKNHQHNKHACMSCVDFMILTLSPLFFSFTELRNGVVVDVFWNTWSLLVLIF